MERISRLARKALTLLDTKVRSYGFTPVVHFELEGGFKPSAKMGNKQLNFSAINQAMAKLNLQAELKPEYWQNQWEYVSLFEGQSPLTEANNLEKAMQILPSLLKQFGAQDVYIRPVIWAGDKGSLATGSKAIFTDKNRDIHIPNAVQLNLSLLDSNGDNLMADGPLAEQIQHRMLQTSYDCCCIFLPEEEAYERLKLKTVYGLTDELSSPDNLSGGHQGSIALYRQWGKHNQPMGVEALLVDAQQNTLTTHQDWRKTARIEHRIGAASRYFSPHLNVVYALANVVDVLHSRQKGALMPIGRSGDNQQIYPSRDLPDSLYGSATFPGGALSLFKQNDWLGQMIWLAQSDHTVANNKSSSEEQDIGSELKQAVIDFYESKRPADTKGASPSKPANKHFAS
ncbi:hypothetical protein [Corallincola holothuriorum]|uniref:hypothetical protein n=1 Tax=Corallincola holothuriorum TaxID=2282215 RepID=UPI0011C042D4|nr:hypothetical protein [Corallincola holothuriorum]